MAIGVGGSTEAVELSKLQDMTADVVPISEAEFAARVEKAQARMAAEGIAAIYVNAGTSLYYFTGTRWWPSERMVGALIPASGPVTYIAPAFEISTINDYMCLPGDVRGWQEHESPYVLFADMLRGADISGKVGLDEACPFFLTDGLAKAAPAVDFVDARGVIAHCRMRKSEAEIALMQRAKDMTLEVHKAAAAILREGITTTEVTGFIHEAHKREGAPGGSFFCIVLFGEATAYPHGVKDPQTLKDGDMVLIDTGCDLLGYKSDITRTYVFGEASEKQRTVWNHEKAAQVRAFEAARLGVRCGDVDIAARSLLESFGYGPGYDVPGLPHRTGHGIGLDIHEWPYLVASDDTPLAAGMCFSNEPMLCLYGEFGVRLEDHFYMTGDGPRWFTEPSHSIDDPFGLKA
ncbi:M24 family metallopeptidase [Kordiimonas aestuarii]|uniref:M24 family metallopeptidase n=1 Tax=Kordiimonas aestuarii TaxID=1005925 RepID=UPI0021D27509|nr:Xaa-Pro peptidase family protein [Kordiimonas aestuarii]